MCPDIKNWNAGLRVAASSFISLAPKLLSRVGVECSVFVVSFNIISMCDTDTHIQLGVCIDSCQEIHGS